MARSFKTALYELCRGHKRPVDDDEGQLTIDGLSAKCQANIATLKSQLPGHIPEALQKLEEFFTVPSIFVKGIPGRQYKLSSWFTDKFVTDQNDLITVKNMLKGIIELTQKDAGISVIEFLDTGVMDKLDWLRASLLCFVYRIVGHPAYHGPLPEIKLLRSKYEILRKQVQHQILQERGSEDIPSPEFSPLQQRLIDAILIRKERFDRARAYYQTVMGTSTSEGKCQEHSLFKSPLQAELKLDMHSRPERPYVTHTDPYRTCPCCFRSVRESDVKDEFWWKDHVHSDIEAYTCIAEYCPEGGHLFSDVQKLEDHMRTSHKKWGCSCCDANFLDLGDLLLHQAGSSRASRISGPRLVLGLRSCPLCPFSADEDSTELSDHVINHMFRFSSKFWPWIEAYDEAGEAPEDSRMDGKAGH